MSKSSGGGGLKSHDKGGSGACKVIKKDQGLEAALDKVPDAILCPANHRMKLHCGSRREGPLTCDGPDDRCCGRDGDGVLHVGDERYSCVECDFDICPPCMEAETGEELTPEQEKEQLRQRLREKAGRSGGGGGSAAAKVKAEAEAKAAALAAKRAEIEMAVADAKAKEAVMALTAPAEEAKQPEETDDAKAAKKKAAAAKKKEKQKAKKAQAQAEAKQAVQEAQGAPEPGQEEDPPAESAAPAPASPPAAAGFAFKPVPAGGTAAPANLTTFTFDWNLSTPPTKGAAAAEDESSSDSDSDSDEVDVTDGGVAGKLAAAALDEAGLLKAPEHPLVCAFTQQIMTDPVILADGHTYERKAAEAYLEKFDRSPRTGEKLAHKSVLPNLLAREMCMCAKQLEM